MTNFLIGSKDENHDDVGNKVKTDSSCESGSISSAPFSSSFSSSSSLISNDRMSTIPANSSSQASLPSCIPPSLIAVNLVTTTSLAGVLPSPGILGVSPASLPPTTMMAGSSGVDLKRIAQQEKRKLLWGDSSSTQKVYRFSCVVTVSLMLVSFF